jgi:3',5'-cyclic-AMP phosphodiesterase
VDHKRVGASRRDVLLAAAAAVAGSALPVSSDAAGANPTAPASGARRALRLAHLTDVHVQPERGAGDGLAACLRHAQGLKDPPQLILTGGDAVMEANSADAARAAAQADVWRRVWKAECSLPVEHCIGNHDVWGTSMKESRTTGREPLWGKKWALDFFGLTNRYRSFDRAGWHFVVLDSTYPTSGRDGYIGRLDDEQFVWLSNDLAATPATTPVLVLSHIPILSIAAMLYENQEKSGDWVIPASWVHMDARQIKDLFRRHPNVKLCLSGHIHLADRVDYAGVTYVCNGAVCGNWWKGDIDATREGYGVVDLYEDGSYQTQYVAYGWTPRA